jgi:outer membrane protein TolC
MAFGLLLVLVPGAFAATPLTLADAEARALAPDAPAMAEAAASIDVAHAALGEARALPDPAFTLGTTRYSPKTTVAVDWSLPLLGQSIPGIQAAKEAEQAAVAESDLARLQLWSRVDLAWTELWAAQERLRLAGEAAKDARSLRDSTQARYEAGDVPRKDAVAAEAAMARADANAVGAEADRRGAAALLAGLVHLQDDLVTDGEPLTGPVASLAVLRENLVQHPESRSDAASVRAAEKRRNAARLAWLPEVTLSAEEDFGDPGLPGTDILGSVGISVPIGGGKGPAVAAAEAEKRSAEARAAGARDRREAELVRSWFAAEGARARLQALEERAIPASESSAKLAREAYEAGESDIFSVLAAQSEANAVRAERVDAVVAAAQGRSDLLLAAGVADVP